MKLPEYGCQFSCKNKSGNQVLKRRYHVRRVAGLSSGSSWQIKYVIHLFIYMFGTTIKLSMMFKFWGCG